MDEKKDYWNEFYLSGNIMSYLSYKEQMRNKGNFEGNINTAESEA